jgi:hypothetical protein
MTVLIMRWFNDGSSFGGKRRYKWLNCMYCVRFNNSVVVTFLRQDASLEQKFCVKMRQSNKTLTVDEDFHNKSLNTKR